MAPRSPFNRAFGVGAVVLVCLALLAGCVDTSIPGGTPTETPPGSGPKLGEPVTDYETFVFDLGPSSDPVIEGGIEVGDEFDAQYHVTVVATPEETARFNRSLLPDDAEGFVDEVSFEDELLVVIQAFPASSVPDYRIEVIARDGPTLHVEINDSSGGGTDDVTVETMLVRIPGDPPDDVIVTTQDGRMFETGRES